MDLSKDDFLTESQIKERAPSVFTASPASWIPKTLTSV